MVPQEVVRLFYHSRNNIIDNVLGHDPTQNSEINVVQSYAISRLTLGEYIVLDYKRRSSILNTTRAIIKYNNNAFQNRPLNFLMHAAPGSGKSYFIKSIVKSESLNNFCEKVVYDMTSFRGIEDFLSPLEAARNIKVRKKLPILFLDEVDSNDQLYSIVLPLLWDGNLPIAGMNLELGKSVIILATSKDLTKDLAERRKEIKKLDDFLSRINGGFVEIPSIDLVTTQRDLRADKVCIALSLFGRRYSQKFKSAPWNILYFIGHVSFRYNVRSITTLIDQLPDFGDTFDLDILTDSFNFLKTTRSLKESFFCYHIDDDQIDEAVELWNMVEKNTSSVIFLNSCSINV